MLATLDEKAIAWSVAPKHEPIKEVWVVPALVRHVGVSGVLDADIDGLAGDLRDRRPVYDDGARLQAVIEYAQALGKRAFSRRTGLKATVAGRAAEGERISKANVHKALRALRVDDGSPRRCRPSPVSDLCSAQALPTARSVAAGVRRSAGSGRRLQPRSARTWRWHLDHRPCHVPVKDLRQTVALRRASRLLG